LLKSDENCSSGESLTFNSHLVDIGNLEGENKPLPDLNVNKKQKNVSRFRTPGMNSFIISSMYRYVLELVRLEFVKGSCNL